MENIFGFFFLAFAGLFICARGSPRDDEIVIQDYLKWNYKFVNKNCSYVKKHVPCKDIRTCRPAAAVIAMGGWPAVCGWVGQGIPRVCCGLPLVLGKKLMEKMNEENARRRRCGTREFQTTLSPTEAQYLKLLSRIMPFVDRENPDPKSFDPPLAPTVHGPREPAYPVGGEPTRQGFFSFMVSIRKDNKHWCGGTVIDRNHILSAAHCFATDRRAPNPSEYVVHVGNIYVEEGFPFSVKKIVIHPGYNPDFYYHDLAILTLNKEILSPQVAQICLPSPEIAATDLTGENTTLLGWGLTEFGGIPATSLHIVDSLPVVPFQECKDAYRRVAARHLPQGLTEDFICAGLIEEGGKDACQSDSGGPLMYTNDPRVEYYLYADVPWIQVGIVSFGFMCGEPGFPGVYIKIANYMDWITQTMKE